MGSQFSKIYFEADVDGILDELSQKVEQKLEHTKSENVRLILEMGYKACLDEFSKHFYDREITHFVDKNDIHDTQGHVPYEDPSITKVTCHKNNEDFYCDSIIHESDVPPDELYVCFQNGMVKYKKV
jgi:hypothetical protein